VSSPYGKVWAVERIVSSPYGKVWTVKSGFRTVLMIKS